MGLLYSSMVNLSSRNCIFIPKKGLLNISSLLMSSPQLTHGGGHVTLTPWSLTRSSALGWHQSPREWISMLPRHQHLAYNYDKGKQITSSTLKFSNIVVIIVYIYIQFHQSQLKLRKNTNICSINKCVSPTRSLFYYQQQFSMYYDFHCPSTLAQASNQALGTTLHYHMVSI